MNFQDTNREFIKTMLIKVWFKNDNNMSLLINQTLNIFDDWMQSEILTALSDEQMDAFDKLVSWTTSDEQIYNFFVKSIKDFDSFMDWLYNKFEKMYISKYKKVLEK